MTRTAIYSLQDNALREQPAIPEPRELDFYSTSVYTGEPSFDDNGLAKAIAEYREHLDNLRTIPCHESARSLWKDGQEVEEGKDYEVREDWEIDGRGNPIKPKGKFVAFPLPVKSEDITDRTFSFDETLGYLIDFGNLVLRNKGEKWDMSNDAAEWLADQLKKIHHH